MGVDTHLYIGNKWQLEDVADVIRANIDGEAKFEHAGISTLGMFECNFTYEKHQRFMFIHTGVPTPLGRCYMLSLRHNDEAVEIMEKIANILGGILEPMDCNGEMHMIVGAMSDEDALPYHLKYAIIHGMDAKDIDGLTKSISDWNKKYRKA